MHSMPVDPSENTTGLIRRLREHADGLTQGSSEFAGTYVLVPSFWRNSKLQEKSRELTVQTESANQQFATSAVPLPLLLDSSFLLLSRFLFFDCSFGSPDFCNTAFELGDLDPFARILAQIPSPCLPALCLSIPSPHRLRLSRSTDMPRRTVSTDKKVWTKCKMGLLL